MTGSELKEEFGLEWSVKTCDRLIQKARIYERFIGDNYMCSDIIQQIESMCERMGLELNTFDGITISRNGKTVTL